MHSHTIKAIRERIQSPKVNYLRDFIYGGIDGSVTTFAIVAGVMGATLAHEVIIILGMANLIGDGFSMAASNFLGTKAEVDEYKKYKAIEQSHIKIYPNGERQEIIEIYKAKGFKGDALTQVVDYITADESLWVNTMLTEEYGLARVIRNPWRAGLTTFIAFIVCGFIPLLPFFINIPHGFLWSIIMTAFIFFLIGSFKSYWSLSKWWWSGLSTFFIGSTAAIIAYLCGFILKAYTN